MQNISLDFFGEKITALMPRDLASLRNIIADRFMFDPEDAAEVIITYMKDLGKKIIKTEEDFKTFLNEKINLISLDISQDSKLYKENFANIEHENVEKKNELENLKKKKEEVISEKKKTINEFTKNVKNIDEQIKKLQNERKNQKNNFRNEMMKFNEEEKEINVKIMELKEKLGIKDDENEIMKIAEEKNILKLQKKQAREKKRQEREKRRQEKEKRKQEKEKKRQEKAKKKQEKKNSEDKKEKINNQVKEKPIEKKEEDKKEDKKEENNPFINIKPITDVINMFGNFIQNNLPIHFPIRCQGCGVFPIIGNRYKCTVCDNFDYCENCEAKFAAQHQHPFLKIYNPSQNPVEVKCNFKEEKK